MSHMFICPLCGERSPGAGHCPRDGSALENGNLDPLLGTEIGPYRVVRRIGAGGMGQVYLGVHPAIGSRVAIKLLSADLAGDAEQVERFFTEARAVNVIRHEGIVNVLDLSRTRDGRPYIVMEFLDGSPLSALISTRGQLPVLPSLCLSMDVLAALEAAHIVGIVHRDIKPDNIFVSPTGRVKLLDFGIAKLRPELAAYGHGTRTGALMGTPYYMSPEQALGRDIDPRSDLYSLGIVLYQMLTGQLPFGATTLFELLRQQVEVQPLPPRSLRPELPPSVEWLLLGALAKDPVQRFPSAAAMATAVSQVIASLPTDGAPPLTGGAASQQRPVPRVPSPVGYQVAAPGEPRTPGWPPSPNAQTPRVTPPAAVLSVPGAAKPRAFGAPALIVSTVVFLVMVGGLGWFAWTALRAAREGLPALTGTTLSSRSTPEPPRGDEPNEPGAASKQLQSLAQRIAAGSGLAPVEEPRHIEVWQHFERAQIEALRTFADAQLVRIDISGMKPDGSVDLTVSGDFPTSVLFRWRSPSASKPPAPLPGSAKYRGRCLYYYLLSEHGRMSQTVDNMVCDETLVKTPRCRPTHIWAKAVAAGAPKGDYIGNLSYFATSDKPASWLVTIGEFSGFLADDC